MGMESSGLRAEVQGSLQIYKATFKSDTLKRQLSVFNVYQTSMPCLEILTVT